MEIEVGISYFGKKNIREEIERIVRSDWPCTPSEIAQKLGLDPKNKKNLMYVLYHVKKLLENGKIMGKKIGSAIVLWPVEIEKLRIVYELVKEI